MDSTQAATPWLDLIVSHRRACQSDIHEPPWEGGGVPVERGNLPISKRCSGSRPMAEEHAHDYATLKTRVGPELPGTAGATD